MKKIINFWGITATVASINLGGNVLLASETQLVEQQITPSQSYPLIHLRADQNWGRAQKGRFTEKLNLTSKQQAQVQNIRSQYQPKINSLKDNLRSERQKLAEMMKTNQPYDKLRSQHQKIMALDQQIHNLRFESMLEMREILTQQQRQEWAELMQEFRTGRRNRFR